MAGDDHVSLRHMERTAEDPHGFRRHLRGLRPTRSGPATGSADSLRVPEAADLVARRHLPRDPTAGILEGPVGVLQPVVIRCIQPFGRIGGVQVVVDVRAVLRAASGVRVDEVPRAVLPDRAAERAGEVVDIGERGRRSSHLVLSTPVSGCRIAVCRRCRWRKTSRASCCPRTSARCSSRVRRFRPRPAHRAVRNVTSCAWPVSTT